MDEWMHSRGLAKMYACAKYHWLLDQQLLRNWLKHKNLIKSVDYEIYVKVKYGWLHSRGHAKMFASAKYHSVGPIVTEKLT